jgi:hypothetical protein
MISPVSITFTILLGERAPMNLSELQRLLSIPEVNISQQNSAKSNPHYSIKSSVQHESKIIEAICRIHEIYGINSLVDLICYSSFDLRPALLQSSYGLFHHNTVSMIAIQTNTSMQFSPQDPCIIISGPPQCIFLARKFLTVSTGWSRWIIDRQGGKGEEALMCPPQFWVHEWVGQERLPFFLIFFWTISYVRRGPCGGPPPSILGPWVRGSGGDSPLSTYEMNIQWDKNSSLSQIKFDISA